jgi:hypothetical protein
MVELTSTSASNGTRNWYLYWYRCISSVDVFIIFGILSLLFLVDIEMYFNFGKGFKS